MPISFSNYVNITSNLAGNSAVETTDLITRVFSVNPLIPTGGAPLTFTSAAQVGSYFGTASEEYQRAVFYFGWISKTNTFADALSFAFWANAATPPRIYGAALATLNTPTTVALLQAVTSGGFALTMGGFTEQVTGLNFSGISVFADAALIIQNAIQAFVGNGALWTAATVAYDATPGDFVLTGGASGAAVISVAAPATGTDISTMIGWSPLIAGLYPLAPIFSAGVAVETIPVTLQNSYEASNNFGSFVFTNAAALDQAQIVAAATWNAGFNVYFMYLVSVTSSTYSAVSIALASIQGTALTLSPVLTPAQFPEMVPGMIMAATNYDGTNTVQSYDFQQFPALTASVTNDTLYSQYTGAGINFYGQTQAAGNPINFYQPGILTGATVNTDITDMTPYSNEIWFKNAAGVQIMNLLLSQAQVPANSQGTAQILGVLQSVIDQALTNGTISTGATLNAIQRAAVTSITNDPNAWFQVQNTGYWVDCIILGTTPNFFAQYTLVYKKDDVIRKVIGFHDLV